MSVKELLDLPCPACGHEASFVSFKSVNADRMPELREQIILETFQATICERCEAAFRLDPDVIYFDAGLGLWIYTLPARDVELWEAREVASQVLWFSLFGPMAPPAAQEIGEGLKARVVFGWAALREKILCAMADVDDATLEIAKLGLLGAMPASQLGDDCELRLWEITDDELIFNTRAADVEMSVDELRVPRALLSEIEAQPEAWATAREAITGAGLFVDLNRTLVAPVDEETWAAQRAAV